MCIIFYTILKYIKSYKANDHEDGDLPEADKRNGFSSVY